MPFCGECGREVEKDWKACPFCGTVSAGEVTRTCESCGKELEKDWITCPFCQPEKREETRVIEKVVERIREPERSRPMIFTSPPQKQPIGVGGFFIVVIIVIILFLVFLAIFARNWAGTATGGICGFIPMGILTLLSCVWYERRCEKRRVG